MLKKVLVDVVYDICVIECYVFNVEYCIIMSSIRFY